MEFSESGKEREARFVFGISSSKTKVEKATKKTNPSVYKVPPIKIYKTFFLFLREKGTIGSVKLTHFLCFSFLASRDTVATFFPFCPLFEDDQTKMAPPSAWRR